MIQSLHQFIKTLLLFPFLWLNDWRQYFIALHRWYRKPNFIKVDCLILLQYLLRQPYFLCRSSLSQYPDDQVQRIYGETFFTTLDLLLRKVDITKDDVVFELGCGRGRNVFFIGAVYGCDAVGIDLTPTFINTANKITNRFQLRNVEFHEANIMHISYKEATIIYLYGSAFQQDAINNLVEAFDTAPPGTRIISITCALHHHAPEGFLTLNEHLNVPFIWGLADAYLYTVNSSLAN